MDLEFKSLEELYNRIKPALRAKCTEFKTIGYSGIKESDIWNYLTETKWKTATDLTLTEMINDIITVDLEDVYKYMEV